MRKTIAIGCALLALSAASVTAEIVEVPLPDLIGFYDHVNYHRNAYFELDRIPLEIHSVEIRLSGTHYVGEVYCDNGGIIEGPYSRPVDLTANMRDTVNDNLWYAEGFPPDVSGEFELTLLFQGFIGQTVTWDFLKSGYSTVSFYGMPQALVTLCWYTIYPDVTIEEATLIIDADFPVAAECSAWGRIKSLFK